MAVSQEAMSTSRFQGHTSSTICKTQEKPSFTGPAKKTSAECWQEQVEAAAQP